ncbi:hypothetical protein [Desulfobacula sp.]|uniref:Core-binding (CB) domain-containing protein n=1 Tax=Candidatus Desulfatibia vada TaxID=2841696 RepID=A0A8J6NUB8_9BACT|nr:hypothetical protein [Candidatus Desulfatibia vada]MBL6996527.1 hypothetical protein [Desulfobacula sp.]
MAVMQLPDGRWICYYRKDGQGKREYFGRGDSGEAAANRRNYELGFGKAKKQSGLTFRFLAMEYFQSKVFDKNPKKLLQIRLHSNILPFFGNKDALALADKDMDAYVKLRRKTVKYSTIARELTDVKAILNWSAKRTPPLISHNPVRDYKKPATDDAVIMPPTKKEASAILKNASPHLQRAIKLSWYLGLPGRR